MKKLVLFLFIISLLGWDTVFAKDIGSPNIKGTLTVEDNPTVSPLNLTERNSAPSSPSSGDIYLDDGTNTASGNPGLRRYTGAAWADIGATGQTTTITGDDSNTTSGNAVTVAGSGGIATTVSGDTVTIDGSGISESDTLDTVTDRGATTVNSIAVGGLNVGNALYSAGSGYFDTGTTNTGQDELFISDTSTSTTQYKYASIGFGGYNLNGMYRPRKAAIAATMDGGEGDYAGLSFFTHPSNDADWGLSEVLTLSCSGLTGAGFTKLGLVNPNPTAYLDMLNRTTSTDSPVMGIRQSMESHTAAAAGFGIYNLVQLEDSAGNNDDATAIEHVWLDATDGSEDSAIIFKTRTAGGALAEAARFFDNDLQLGSSYIYAGEGEFAGRIGIGTNTPARKFSVNGTVSCGILYPNSIDTNGDIIMGANLYRIKGTLTVNGALYAVKNGNVGIGVTSPSSKLDVNGAITSRECSADPADPDEGSHVIWQSDGTGAGDDGDIMVKITVGGVTKTTTLIDFSELL